MTEWLKHYHRERPHQAKDNGLLVPSKQRRKQKPTRASPPTDVLQLAEVR